MTRVSVLLGFLTVVNLGTVLGDAPQLRLVNVLFRHGDRTPDVRETFPTDQYCNHSYSPISRGGLTNGGKQREYYLGQVLRSLYDNFLGPFYETGILEARSTDFERTKMSLQLVLAGLFPPKSIQIWNKTLLWQPIPINYWQNKADYILRSEQCPKYGAEYARVLDSSDVKKRIAEFEGLAENLEILTGQKIDDISIFYELYLTFSSQEASGLVLPKWVYEYYPNGELLNATGLYYEISYYNNVLRRLSGGMLLSKILEDAVDHRNGTGPEGRKLYLYSAHEVNIASLLSALGVYKPHVPAFSSAVVIELWEQNYEYYFKVLYYTGIPSKIITQRIPGCSEMCPMDKFIKILKPVTATDSDLTCS